MDTSLGVKRFLFSLLFLFAFAATSFSAPTMEAFVGSSNNLAMLLDRSLRPRQLTGEWRFAGGDDGPQFFQPLQPATDHLTYLYTVCIKDATDKTYSDARGAVYTYGASTLPNLHMCYPIRAVSELEGHVSASSALRIWPFDHMRKG